MRDLRKGDEDGSGDRQTPTGRFKEEGWDSRGQYDASNHEVRGSNLGGNAHHKIGRSG